MSWLAEFKKIYSEEEDLQRIFISVYVIYGIEYAVCVFQNLRVIPAKL